MTTSEPDGSATDLTPDCVVQKSPQYGIVAEVKKSLPVDAERWEPVITQLRSYDGDLQGWWTDDGLMPTADAVLLVHQSRGRRFAAYIAQAQERDDGSVGQNSSVVEFNRSDEHSPYIFFRREFGAIRDPGVASKLEDGTQVPIHKVLRSFPSIKYYDAPPSIELLMVNLWIDHLASRASSVEPADGVVREFTVSVDELTQEAQRSYGSAQLQTDARSAEFPKQAWVRDALRELVKLRLASKTDDPDQFMIRFRPLKGDLLERFVAMRDRLPRRLDGDEERQLQLPLAPPPTSALPNPPEPGA